VLGYLDDLLIVPFGILLAIRMIPASLMQEFRQRAALQTKRPVSWAGLVSILIIWSPSPWRLPGSTMDIFTAPERSF